MTDTLTHHEMTAEGVDDGRGRGIMLTQPADNYDDPETVLVHPWQLRAVCDQFGIITSDPQPAKAIGTLTRRLRLLRDRIEILADGLAEHSGDKRGGLTSEIAQFQALKDLVDECCHCLDDDEQAAPKTSAPAPTVQGKLP